MKKEKNYYRCLDCQNAYLMGEGNDPVISKCPFNHERQVASCPIECDKFKENKGEKVIHKMINCK